MSLDAPLIEARDLTKTYEQGKLRVVAVDRVDLTVRRGEVLAIIGPSGSGKTTLLSMLGCLLRPTSGTLSIDGQDVSALGEDRLPEIRRRYIGFIFQSFNLFSNLSALENVLVAFQIKGLVGAAYREKARRLLEDVGLGDRLHFRPRDMSGGQKQRVSVARALAGTPPVILADEPTGNLDSRTGMAVTELLCRLASRDRCAVVIVTHDNRITRFLDRILYLEDGRIREGAAPHDAGLSRRVPS